MMKDYRNSIQPQELKIEITRACNLSCSFCYLGDVSLWRKNRHMSDEQVLHWIDWAVENNITAVRFTGGEATLHPNIEMYCNYAILRKRYVILNTNGMANDEVYDRLLYHLLLVSLPTLNPKHMDEITKHRGVLEKKVSVIDKALDKSKVTVSVSTMLGEEHIGHLEEYVNFVRERPGLIWTPLRWEPSVSNTRPVSKAHMQALAEEMDALMQLYPEQAPGINSATPFCSVTPTGLGARVFNGRAHRCGPFVSLNVNFDGMLSGCIGTCDLPEDGTLEDVRNSPGVRNCCSVEALPVECHNCEYVYHCAGGCRKPIAMIEHGGRQVDYLAGFAEESVANNF